LQSPSLPSPSYRCTHTALVFVSVDWIFLDQVLYVYWNEVKELYDAELMLRVLIPYIHSIHYSSTGDREDKEVDEKYKTSF
jgi:hypothetical protein